MTRTSDLIGAIGCITDYPDAIEYLECHMSHEEIARLKKDPINFYLGSDDADRSRIENAIECRLHKRQMPMAAE